MNIKIYDKRDDFGVEIMNFPFLDGDVPRSTFYGVYISQLIRFARASSHVVDLNTRNTLFTRKLHKQGCRCHKLIRAFSEFYRRCCGLVSGFQVGLRKRKKRSHGKRKNGNLKRKNLHAITLSDLSITLKHSGQHMALSRLLTLSISLLRSLDIEANKFYDRAH